MKRLHFRLTEFVEGEVKDLDFIMELCFPPDANEDLDSSFLTANDVESSSESLLITAFAVKIQTFNKEIT